MCRYPYFVATMRTHGYGEELVKKVSSENWMKVLERTWGG